MTKHGWFVLVRGLEGANQWECAYTTMFDTKRSARRMLRDYRRGNPDVGLSFYLAKARVVPARLEVTP
ncbi:hypothetical protein [Nocardia sp. NPDC049149]|uniref:hypothetical protein n=1 Tax=Nocardia sp. NPDC049149 TaxID=3364315 RepID=UPI0037193122